jgi:hypothetical protein
MLCTSDQRPTCDNQDVPPDEVVRAIVRHRTPAVLLAPPAEGPVRRDVGP